MNSFNVSFPGLNIFDLMVNRVIFEFNLFGKQITIYWYGLLIALAFGVGLFLALKHADRYNLSADDVIDVFILAIPLAIVGARLYYVIFSWDEFKDDLIKVFNIPDGGLAFYGGVLGGIIAVLIICKVKNIRFSHYLDFFAPYLALGQAIGRWGNFFNQEAFGTTTDLPWGMISEGTKYYLARIGYPTPNSPVHPTFLYESLGNLLIVAVLINIRRKSKIHYETTAWYFIMYGALRYFTEGLRTDSLYLFETTLRVSQLISIVMFASAFTYLMYSYSKQKSIPESEQISAFARFETELIPADTDSNLNYPAIKSENMSDEADEE